MRIRPLLSTSFLIAAITVSACRHGEARNVSDRTAASVASTVEINDTTLPPNAENAVARLDASPRHGEYVMIPVKGGDSLRAWVVYPSRSTKAPVIVVIHEIFGMSSWVRAVADQLSAAGYITVTPDLLTNQHLPGAPDHVSMQDGIVAVSKLNPADVQRDIDAAASYGMARPAALPKYGVVGFCWGGGVAFQHAVHSPTLSAVVVYYGTSPATPSLASVKAPVIAFYGGNDARVVATIPPADSAMRAMGKTFEHHVYDGAEHGFLRAQNNANGANLKATRQAWPATLAWFRQYLGS